MIFFRIQNIKNHLKQGVESPLKYHENIQNGKKTTAS